MLKNVIQCYKMLYNVIKCYTMFLLHKLKSETNLQISVNLKFQTL